MNIKAKRKMNSKVRPWTILIYLILSVLVVIYITPLLWMLNVSMKTNHEVLTEPFKLSVVIQLGNYINAWVKGNLGRAMINSVLVCTISLVLSLALGSMAAFAIARMYWKLAEGIMGYFLIGMMIPIHCVLIPLFVRFSKWGLTDSLTGLIIPYTVFALPLVIFLMNGFFKSMPKEIYEAACIDGCSIYGCFFRIALPLAKTGLFVAGLMTFVANWNELLMALVFISDSDKKTLPVTLTYFVGPYSVNYVQMFAAIIIALVPTIIVYIIFSNQIVEGLTTGAVKG